MQLENKSALYFLYIAFFLAFIVVQLGALTRLKDAGLGCPDWPGCYGKLTLPNKSIQLKNGPYSGQMLIPEKAWPEMIHRYAAATLVILCFAGVVLIIYKYKLPQQPIWIATSLLFFTVFARIIRKMDCHLATASFGGDVSFTRRLSIIKSALVINSTTQPIIHETIFRGT